MEGNQFRRFLSRNILFTNEVSEKLNMSRQRISLLNKSGDLLPVKSTKNGSVYLLQDVLIYMEKNNMLPKKNNPKPPRFLCADSSTYSNVDYAKEHLNELGAIDRVSIFFERIDAAMENYYILQEECRYGDLISLLIPHMVIHSINGEEMWLPGCNCGYSGTGPHGSEEILQYIGIEQVLIDQIFNYPVVKFIKNEDNQWEVLKRESEFDFRSMSISNELYKIDAHMYWHQGRLTLVQKKSWDSICTPQLVLEKYWAFIPNPSEYILFSNNDQAIDNGFFDPFKNNGFLSNGAYKLIIRDFSGRQLWLDPLVESNKSLKKQPQLQDILYMCGFLKENEKIDEKLKRWMELLIKRVDPGDPLTGVRDPFREI